MSGSTTLAFWQLILIALGPAVLTAGVSIFGPIVVERRREQAARRREEAEKRQRRAEKFEELITTTYEFNHWLDAKRVSGLFGGNEITDVSTLAKVLAITSTYFPQLLDFLHDLEVCESLYGQWIINAKLKDPRAGDCLRWFCGDLY